MTTIRKERAFNFAWKHFQAFLQKMVLSNSLFIKNELINHAGASAFFFLLSIPPVLLLILIGFDRYMASYPDVSEHFFSFLKTLNSNLDKESLNRIGLLNVNTAAVGIFGLLNLLWAGRWILSGIQRGMEIIFPAEKIRPPIVVNVFSFFILSILLLLAVLITFISISFQFYVNLVEDSFFFLSFFQSFIPIIKNLFLFFTVFLGVFLVYRFIPVKRPKTLPSISGAMLCTISIILLHMIFSEFFSVAQYNVFYGILGSLILMALWVHFSFMLFFFFAEFTYVSDKIDVLVLERVYFFQLRKEAKANKIEKFLFRHPKQVFEKYARHFDTGEILFLEGDRSLAIYFIYQGQIGVYRQVNDEERKIAVIREGEILGEMAYLLDENRTATAKAEVPSILLVITPEIFEELLMVNRIVSRDVIHTLSDRLRKIQLPEKP
jgi:membrane protein